MQYNTEFYKLLRQAVYDDTALVRVLDKIMKLINSNSKDDNSKPDTGKDDNSLHILLNWYEIKKFIKNLKFDVHFFDFFVLFIVEGLKNFYYGMHIENWIDFIRTTRTTF